MKAEIEERLKKKRRRRENKQLLRNREAIRVLKIRKQEIKTMIRKRMSGALS